MGTIENGWLGGFKGILGPAVGSKWKNKYVVRSRPPRKRTSPTSNAQADVQAKFLLMTKFLRPLTALLNKTFNKSARDMTGFNKAFSANKKAITGLSPAFTIDYPKILLSTGTLRNADAITVASPVMGKLVFTWTDNSGSDSALSSDPGFVAVYNEELKRWIQNQKISQRSDATFTLDAAVFSGKPVHCYIGFMSADNKKVSESFYAGTVNVL